jgi:hypothetical protein
MNELQRAVHTHDIDLSNFHRDEPVALALAAVPDLEERSIMEQLTLIVMATELLAQATDGTAQAGSGQPKPARSRR